MHRPPAAHWDVRAGRWHARLLFFLAGLAASAFAAFVVLQPWGAAPVLVGLVLAGSVLGAGYGWRAAPCGTLRWDGEHWHWLAAQDEVVSELRCILDLQHCMVLQVRTEAGRRVWCWVESGAMEPRWQAFRRAVVASGGVREPVEPGAL